VTAQDAGLKILLADGTQTPKPRKSAETLGKRFAKKMQFLKGRESMPSSHFSLRIWEADSALVAFANIFVDNFTI